MAQPIRWLSEHRVSRVALAISALGAAVAVSFGAGYRSSDAALGDGSAYLQQDDRVVRVNADSGDVDAAAARALAPGRQRLEVVQVSPGSVYSVNHDTGEVIRLPTDTMQPQEVEKRPGSRGRLTVVAGGGRSYLVDGALGTVRRLGDGGGPDVDVPLPAPVDQMVVDRAGRGWAYAPSTGELLTVAADGVARQPVAGKGEPVVLTLVGDRPVLYHPLTGQVAVYGRDGLDQRIDLTAENGVVAVPSDGNAVVVVVRRTAEVVVADVGGGDGVRVQLDGRAGHRFGRPVVFHGRAYVPDYDARHVLVVDLAGRAPVTYQPVPGHADPFDVFARDDRVWVHDPFDKTVLTFDPQGRATTVSMETGRAGTSPGPSGRPTAKPSRSTPAPSGSAGQPSTSATSAQTVVVPDVVGQNRARACQQLRPALQCVLVARPDGGGTTDTVLSTNPPAGRRVPAGTRVTVVYRGPAEVPALTGMPAAQACDTVRQAGLNCVQRTEGLADTAAQAFRVTGQQPEPGTKIATDGDVTIVYANQVRVPNVVGQTVDAACAATGPIVAAGFTCGDGNLGSAPTTSQPLRQIVRQLPSPAVTPGAVPGAAITVHYYSAYDGATAATVPQVGGMSPAQACATLQAAQLGCVQQAEATREFNVVHGQNPGPGATVPAGTAVAIVFGSPVPIENLARWKAPAPQRANFLAAPSSGQAPPAGWSAQPSTPMGVYPPGTRGVPGTWIIYRSRCASGCAFGYYLSANTNLQAGYVELTEAFVCFDPNAAPPGTRPLYALLLTNPAGWVWAMQDTGEWNAFRSSGTPANQFVVCSVWA